MSNTINGRTPEEIKRGLECCIAHTSCDICPYLGTNNCMSVNTADAISYIRQLERERDAEVEAQPKWISVEERLPGDPDDVVGEVVEILIEKGGNILCVVAGFYDHQEKHWVVYDGLYTPDVCDGCYAVVRKWRPLPEPPKEVT